MTQKADLDKWLPIFMKKNRRLMDALSGHTEPDEMEFQIYAAEKELMI